MRQLCCHGRRHPPQRSAWLAFATTSFRSPDRVGRSGSLSRRPCAEGLERLEQFFWIYGPIINGDFGVLLALVSNRAMKPQSREMLRGLRRGSRFWCGVSSRKGRDGASRSRILSCSPMRCSTGCRNGFRARARNPSITSSTIRSRFSATQHPPPDNEGNKLNEKVLVDVNDLSEQTVRELPTDACRAPPLSHHARARMASRSEAATMSIGCKPSICGFRRSRPGVPI